MECIPRPPHAGSLAHPPQRSSMPMPLAAASPSLARHRPFALFWCARVAGTIAYQMQAVAIGWQIYDLTGSALDLGLIGLVQFVPVMLLAPVVGHVADRRQFAVHRHVEHAGRVRIGRHRRLVRRRTGGADRRRRHSADRPDWHARVSRAVAHRHAGALMRARRQNERAGVATGPARASEKRDAPQATPRGVSSSSRIWRLSGRTVSRSGTMMSSPG